MNKHFSLFFHSLLIVGTLLPLSPLASELQSQNSTQPLRQPTVQSAVQPTAQPTVQPTVQPTAQPTAQPADATQMLAYGGGAPRYRAGGGTR
jgi:PT repeat